MVLPVSFFIENDNLANFARYQVRFLTCNFLFCNLCSGGWAILQISPHPILVGDTLKFTCRVRANPQLDEVFLYKDGVEVMGQKGPNPHFYLTNVNLKDQGTYSCRASWDIDRRTRSVISSDVPVEVLGEFPYRIAYVEYGCDCGSHVKRTV